MRMRDLRFAAVIVAAFVCAAQVSEAQTVTLVGNAVPSTPVESDTAAVTLGVKFWSSQPGTIAGVRFYRGYKASSSGYTVKLFSAGGTLLASARTAKDTCAVPCWEEVNFASPISIASNTTYVAAYYTGNGRYADDQYGLANGTMSGPLVAPASGQVGGNGVYTYSTGFPTQVWNASNYYVDISFTPSAPQVAQTPKAVSFSPAGPVNVSDTAPAGTTIAAIQVTTSDGKPFAGTVSISAQSVNGMVSLSSSALPSNVQVARINSSDDGTQTASVQACENGTCTSPATLSMNVVANQSGANITGLSLSNTSFAGSAPDGTLVGNITVTTSDSSRPMLSLIGVQTGSGNDASSFRISSSQLLTNTATGATDQPGQYNICIVASGNYSNSPQQICPTIQARGPGGAGWQLAFSDEFVCPDGMLECLSTVSASSFTWSNTFCPGLSSPSATGCGTLTVASLPTGISAANCAGLQLGACAVSISGATNAGSGGNAAVNGTFLVAGVPDSTHITLYMPYPGIAATMGGTITVGSGPWVPGLNTNCSSGPCTGLPLTASNDNSDKQGFDPHDCVVTDGTLQLVTNNVGYVPPASMQISGYPYTYDTCHVQTWTGSAGFAIGGEWYRDVYMQFPPEPGLDAAAWILGSNNVWPGGGEIDDEMYGNPAAGSNMTHDVVLATQASSLYFPGAPYGTMLPSDLTAGFHQYGIHGSASLAAFYVDNVLQARTTNTNQIPQDSVYSIIDVGVGDSFTGGTSPTGSFPKIMYLNYDRWYRKVSSGACYGSDANGNPNVPPGTTPHTGTC
jgi:hypothetical protein